MKRLIALCVALVLSACSATMPASPSSVLVTVASSLGSFDEQVGQAAFAGRLSSAKATALLDESSRIRAQMNEARVLLLGCEPDKPCEAFDASLRGINDRLIEAQCRRKQAEAGLSEDVCKLPPRAPK